MSINLFTKPCKTLDGQAREPTLLAIALTVIGFAVLLAICAAAIVALPMLGLIWWVFGMVTVVLVGLIVSLLRQRKVVPIAGTGRQRWFRRVLAVTRLLFIGVLACWLALILWLAFCPGGPEAPPKPEAASIRVMTWNIHCGQDHGPPWKQFDWPARKQPLRTALQQAQPDILCVQEATADQVAFLEETLPGHHRVGVGRDDGKSGGEHCAIFFNHQRFEELGGSTFWLEEPIDQPRVGSALDVKRICTWVRLRDRVSGRTLRLYNTHLYLTEAPRLTAAKLILAQITAGDPADAVVLTADFNASPAAPSRRLFTETGLADSADRAGRPIGASTFQLYGIGYSCLDGILVDRHWRVDNHLIWDVKPNNTYPSDHFALLADLGLRE